MLKKRRTVTPFGLAFLDVMSCGFGAAVLIFMLIKHNIAESAIADTSGGSSYQMAANLQQLKQQTASNQENISKVEGQIVDALKTLAIIEADQQSADDELKALKKQLKAKEAALLKEKQKGQQITAVKGAGKRQYLTGLRVEGKRILILFDRSASMVDDELVNILRAKYLPPSERRKGGKWLWGTSILRWLLAHLPANSQYQIVAFNDKLSSPMPKGWQNANDTELMNKVLRKINAWHPQNGTDLKSPFRFASRLDPAPDAIYLITDGLPTLRPGRSQTGLVDGNQRVALFQDALKQLPRDVAVHTILLPTKGDPRAAAAFWGLAAHTGGRFLAPAWDWP